MIDSQAISEELIEKLKGRGYRITPQRLAILNILIVGDGHPGAEQIYERIKGDFSTISLATVYKTIATLKDMDEVLELGFADDNNRYNGNKPYPMCTLSASSVARLSTQRWRVLSSCLSKSPKGLATGWSATPSTSTASAPVARLRNHKAGFCSLSVYLWRVIIW